MGLGRMTTTISLVSYTIAYDSEAFSSREITTLKTVKAYREGRHGSEAWRNRAAFSTATDLFVIRNPGIPVKTDMAIICGSDIFDITSVENVKGRGVYLEILAKEVKPSGQS